MAVKLVKGDALKFGTYGMEHINLPPERNTYWDSVKVAKICDSKTFSEPRFGISFEKAPACAPFLHRFAEYEEVLYIVSGGPLRITYKGQTMDGVAGDFFIFPQGDEIMWEIVRDVVYITCHYPPVDLIIKAREQKFGLRQK